ncbi:hypothetical protein BRSU_2630 [Brachyspira suanatina]|uniref:Uncharacterized protein n=1 Tax=Brachyspira suanatina TaxID=381802 RepID=A0A0G4KA73_9SPIR|nr:hypothetical protein [Brachyspira suanatina]CRF35400.1 hypothetical protein BRSU_2630 [Brachyspira suanatina]
MQDKIRTLEDAKKRLGNNLLILENKNSIIVFDREKYALHKKNVNCIVFTKEGKFKYYSSMTNDLRLYKRLYNQLSKKR